MKAHISHEWWCYFILKCHHIWNFFLCAVVRLYTFQVFLFFLMIWCDGKHFRKTRSLRTQNKWYLGEKLHYFPYASFHALQPRNRNWCIFHGIYFGLVSKLLSKHYNVSLWYSWSIWCHCSSIGIERKTKNWFGCLMYLHNFKAYLKCLINAILTFQIKLCTKYSICQDCDDLVKKRTQTLKCKFVFKRIESNFLNASSEKYKSFGH